jgi:predicted transcriptional regulator
MASKYEIEQMLKQEVENTNRLTKHIEALWDEIGQKQTRVQELNWEIDELKADNKELLSKCKEHLEKHKRADKAQFQKEWLEHYNPSKVDN